MTIICKWPGGGDMMAGKLQYGRDFIFYTVTKILLTEKMPKVVM
jgi:hypothetical protein